MPIQRLLLAIVLGVATAGALAPARTAAAQGDWNVKRDPFDRQVIARYKAILARNPADRDALNKLVALYKRHRTVALLIDEYSKALAKDPKSFSNLVVLGNIHAGEGKRDEALAYFERAAAVKPGDAGLQTSLGDLYRQQGDPAKASAAYEAALAGAGNNTAAKKRLLRALADLALDANDVDGARRRLEQYLALAPGDVQVRIDLGDALLQHGKGADAVTFYRQAEAKLGGDPAQRVEVIARIGSALEKTGDDDGAIREYKRAMAMVARGYYLRRDLTKRIVEIHRRHQSLAALAASYEKEWPAGQRDHFEWDTLAQLYEEIGLQDKAIAAFRAAVKKAPWELDTQRRLITLLENSGRDDEAIVQFETVVKVAPGEPRFQLDLAERYWRRDQQSKALALLKKMEGRFPTDPSVYEALADLYTRWGKDDLALAAYVRLTQIEPNEVDHLVDLGIQYYQRNERARALEVWKRIITVKTAANYARLADVYADHDMKIDALAMYAKAIKLEPKNPDYYRGRSQVYERDHKWLDAINDLGKVLDLTDDSKINKQARREARKRIVQLYQRWGINNLTRQKLAWKAEFSRTPPSRDAGWFLVEAGLREGKYREAQQALEKLRELDDKDTEVISELARVYREQKMFDDAVKTLLRLLELSPGREREIYTTIAEIKSDAKQDDEAVHYVQMALEKSPNDPVAYVRLAERYEAMQDEKALGRAIAAYEKAVELAPTDYPVQLKLAQLYQRERDTQSKAAALYRKILEQASDEQMLQEAGDRAIRLALLTGTLGDLERVIAPLAFTYAHKPIYRHLLVDLYERYVTQLNDQRREGGPAAAAARTELARLGTHGLAPLLEALADDHDIEHQKIAVGTLGYLGNKNAAAPLVRMAMRPVDSGRHGPAGAVGIDIDTRVDALVAAGRLGDSQVVPDLIVLAGHAERAIREAAVFGLGRSHDKRALAPLLAALGDRNESVQAQACLALAELRAPTSVGKLAAVLADRDRRDATRAACAWALGVLGSDAAVTPLLDALAEGNDETQRLAAWALGQIGERRAIPALLVAYFSRSDEIRATAGWALARLDGGRPMAVADLDVDYEMSEHTFDAAATVATLPGPLPQTTLAPGLLTGHERDIVTGLRAALARHTDLRIRTLAALDQLPDRISLGTLTAELARAPAAERAKINGLLDRLGATVAGDLIELARDRDPMVRDRSLAVLAKIDSPAVTPALIAGLGDAEPMVRKTAMAAAALHARNHPENAGALAAAVAERVRSKDWRERSEAAEALGRFGERADGAALIAALADPIGYVREAAARSLGVIGDSDAIAALTPLLTDPDPGVVAAAKHAVAALRDRKK